MQNAGIIHYALYWNGKVVYNAYISEIMFYKALLWTDVFWKSYRIWYKFYNNTLLVVLGSKQRGTLKLVNWASTQLLTLLTFLFILSRCQFIFQWKQKKRKVRKCLKSVKNFLLRFALWIIFHFKTYIRLGTFRYNCVRGQLNNEGGR